MEEGERLTRIWFEEVWNRGRVELLDEMIDPEAIAYGLDGEDTGLRGPEGFKTFYHQFRSAFSDLNIQLEKVVCQGDTVMSSYTATATHSGDGMGVPPTGKRVRFSGQGWVKIRDGKAIESRSHVDFLGLMEQIGAVRREPGNDMVAGKRSETDRNKQLVRRWFEEVWNEGRVEAIDELCVPDATGIFGLADEEGLAIPELFRKLQAQFRTAFPDLRITLEDVLADGDRTAVRMRIQGTHLGEGLGMPPTGRQVDFTGMTFTRWQNGRIVEGWNNVDFPAMREQLQRA